jgi:hypothetical protein
VSAPSNESTDFEEESIFSEQHEQVEGTSLEKLANVRQGRA